MAKTAIDGNSGVLLLLLVGVGVSEFWYVCSAAAAWLRSLEAVFKSLTAFCHCPWFAKDVAWLYILLACCNKDWALGLW